MMYNINEIEKIKEKIKEYKGEDLYVEFSGAINYYFVIHESNLLVSNEFLVISDGKQENLYIEMCYIDDVKINDNCMVLETSNEITIKFDY